MGRPPEGDGLEYSYKQKIFIKRERIRRALIKTKPGETICLNYEQVDLLLKWMKELEERAKHECKPKT